jgi:hypothetical protein
VKTKVTSTLIVVVLLAGVFIFFAQSAVQAQWGSMSSIRFTGTVYPADKKDVTGGLGNLKIYIGKKEWIYNVTNVENLNDPTMTSLEIMDNLFPFQKPDILGKTVTMQGILVTGAQLFQVDKLMIGSAKK